MCSHFLTLHTRQYVQQPRVPWRCSTCGRESYAPIDCCTRPDFVSMQHPGAVRVCVRWLGKLGSRALTRFRALLHRRRRPTVGITLALDRLTHESVTVVAVEPVADTQQIDTQTDSVVVGETTHMSV